MGKPVHLRSPHWHHVEKEHLAKEPACQWCGYSKHVQVHHIRPFHLAPELELDPSNLITLCEEGGYLNCHLVHGHNGDFKSFNLAIRQECEEHKKGTDRVLLEAIRRQDPEMYEFLINAKEQRKRNG
jgi:hypothetical protein